MLREITSPPPCPFQVLSDFYQAAQTAEAPAHHHICEYRENSRTRWDQCAGVDQLAQVFKRTFNLLLSPSAHHPSFTQQIKTSLPEWSPPGGITVGSHLSLSHPPHSPICETAALCCSPPEFSILLQSLRTCGVAVADRYTSSIPI